MRVGPCIIIIKGNSCVNIERNQMDNLLLMDHTWVPHVWRKSHEKIKDDSETYFPEEVMPQ